MKIFRCLSLMLMLLVSVSMMGQYNPTNPAEPGGYTLTLKSTPSGAGYFNINTSTTQQPGASVSLRAYSYSNYTFEQWEDESGTVVSTSSSYTYTMPSANATLVARYAYSPGNPGEPSAKSYSRIYLNASPSGGGSFNISSGNKYEVGTTVTLRAYTASDYVFAGWTIGGDTVSTSSSFNYTVTENDAQLIAHFTYSPGSPGEPSPAVTSHRLMLKSNPSGGGWFNISSGNSYSVGESVYLCAYSDNYYTFKNWTVDGEVVSTSAYFNYEMPDRNVTLTANYDYEYSPGNPSEPSQSATEQYHLYGMREGAVAGQRVLYPVYLENMGEVTGFSVDITFPAGFTVSESEAQLSARANGQTLSVTSLGENAFRFVVRGSENISGANGKMLEVPVLILDTATAGNVFSVKLEKGVIIKADGTQTTIAVRSGSLKVQQAPEEQPDSPDFTVSNITTSTTEVAPGETIHVAWTVSNDGNLDATGGWSERISLVNENGKKITLSTLYYDTDRLEIGGSVNRQADLTLAKLPGIEGNVKVSITLVPSSYAGEVAACQTNNTSESASYSIKVAKQLYLTLPEAAVAEESASAVRCQLARSGNWTENETFTITKVKGDERMTVPATVTIPRDQSAVYFYVSVANNNVLDDDSIFVISASGNGYDTVEATMVVEDDEQPELAISASQSEVTEGDTFTLTVTLPRTSGAPVTVGITSEQPKRFSHVSSVTIPAGQTTATVEVTATDNDDVELQTTVAFKATALKYQSGECLVVLNDNDLPVIDLTLTPATVSESAGPAAIVATLHRTTNTDKRVTITLSDDSNGDIYYSNSQIVLEKGIEQVQFSLGVIDNAIVDGDRTVNLTAAVYVSSCNCSAGGSSAGVVTKQIVITDNDGPSLSLVSSTSSLLEGSESGATLTISRNTDTSKPLTVNISSDSDDRLSYNHTVTIPAGSSSVAVSVISPKNDTSGDSKTVAFTVEADGFSKGTCWLMLTDQTLPDATITDIILSSQEEEVGGEVTVNVTVRNMGAAVLPETTKVGLYMSNSTESVGTIYLRQALAAGEQITVSKTVALPSTVGSYSVYAVANDGQAVKELLYVNNTSDKVSIKTIAPFAATVKSDKQTYQIGEKIQLAGVATGKNVANSLVEIYLVNGGLRQTIETVTDDKGEFNAVFEPYSSQMGHYVIGACYPDENLKDEMASFDIYGLDIKSKYSQAELNIGEQVSGSVYIKNPSALPLTNLTVTPTVESSNCEVTWQYPNAIAAGETVEVRYSIKGNAVSEGDGWQQMPVEITTAEGATSTHVLYYYVHSLKAKLKASSSNIKTTITKGQTRDYPIKIYNEGKGETGKITISTPSPWVQCATSAEVASLANGDSATVVLRFSTTDDMQLNNPVSSKVAVNCENADGIVVNISLEPVSDERGTLTIDVCDEYTYYTTEAPHLAGATVTVQHPVTKTVIATGTSDSNGLCSFDLAEGYYYVTVTEAKHSSYANNIMVDPGVETKKTVNLFIDAISVEMKYEETEIEDEYNIVTTTKYETNVPKPVVETVLPSRIAADELQVGEALIFDVVLTNRGLITAKNTQISLPESQDDLEFDILGGDEFDLAPQQSMTISVKVTKTAGEASAKGMRKASGKGSCHVEEITWYEYDCGDDNKQINTPHTIQVKVCSSSTDAGVTSGARVDIPYVKADPVKTYPTTPPNNKNDDHTQGSYNFGKEIAERIEAFACDPCVNNFFKNVAKCNDFDPDHPIQSMIQKIPIVGDIAGCGFDIYNNSYGKGETMTLANSGDALFKCALKACQAIGGILKGVGTASAATGVGAVVAVGGAVAEAVCKIIDEGMENSECAKGLLFPCDDESSAKRKTRKANSSDDLPSYITQHQQRLTIFYEGHDAISDYLRELIGFEDFYNSDNEDMAALFEKMSEFSESHIIELNEIKDYKPGNVSDEVFAAFIERYNNTIRRSLGETVEGDYIDQNKLDECAQRVLASIDDAKALGYEGIGDMIEDSYTKLVEGYQDQQQSVCASVTLQFSQTMTMTRQAIRGTLTVFNGHETDAMKDVKLNVTVLDEDGNAVGSNMFQISPESIKGFEGQLDLQDGWSLKANEEGVATILFIPTKYAAPTTTVPYTFTGYLSYTDPFSETVVTRDFTPVTLTVKPSPNLDLNYFMQRDIYGDDPLTADVIEPKKPAEFALVINNKGYGDATNVRMTTNQPEIVENEKGLLIDFSLVSSQVNGADKTLSFGETIANDFGTIPAHSTAYAQWWLESTLLGHFTDYQVEANHVTSYGNEDLSLLDNVSIHELIHGFTFNGKAEPVTRAFLVNDIVDADDQPDMVYFSDGTDEQSVAAAKSMTMTKTGELTYSVCIVPSENGWNYASVTDPTAGKQTLTSIVRQSDGASMPLDNFWQTDRTLRDGKDPLYENRLHAIVTADNTETYTLTFSPKPDVELEVESFSGLPEQSLSMEQVTKVGVTFNKAIDDASFTTEDLTLNCQGKAVDLSQIKIAKVSDTEYSLDLSSSTLADGYYVLTVQTAGITDTDGFNGSTGKQVTWTQYVDGKVALTTTASPAAGGKVSPQTSRVDYNSKVTLKATPNEGYDFAGWKHGDETLSKELSLEYLMTEDETFTALFTLQHFNVNIDYDAAQGVVENAATGIYDYGTVLTMKAVAGNGYTFSAWKIDGENVGTDATLSYTVKDNATVQALFDVASSIRDLQATGELRLTPLPMRDVLYVYGEFNTIQRISLTDLSGHVWLSLTDQPNGVGLNVSSLSKGIYVIRVVTDNGTFVRKIVKK